MRSIASRLFEGGSAPGIHTGSAAGFTPMSVPLGINQRARLAVPGAIFIVDVASRRGCAIAQSRWHQNRGTRRPSGCSNSRYMRITGLQRHRLGALVRLIALGMLSRNMSFRKNIANDFVTAHKRHTVSADQ